MADDRLLHYTHSSDFTQFLNGESRRDFLSFIKHRGIRSFNRTLQRLSFQECYNLLVSPTPVHRIKQKRSYRQIDLQRRKKLLPTQPSSSLYSPTDNLIKMRKASLNVRGEPKGVTPSSRQRSLRSHTLRGDLTLPKYQKPARIRILTEPEMEVAATRNNGRVRKQSVICGWDSSSGSPTF